MTQVSSRQWSQFRGWHFPVAVAHADSLLMEMRTGKEHRSTGDSWPAVEHLLTTLVTGSRTAPADPPCWGCAYWRACPASTRRAGADAAQLATAPG